MRGKYEEHLFKYVIIIIGGRRLVYCPKLTITQRQLTLQRISHRCTSFIRPPTLHKGGRYIYYKRMFGKHFITGQMPGYRP